MEVNDLPRKEVSVLFKNRFADAVQAHPVDYCDIHDLLAVVVARSQTVAVLRINGQTAFNVARKDDECTVRVLKWKPDGTLLGVGWSDGMIGVYSGEDGKLMSQMTVRKDEARDEWKLDLAPDYDDFDDGPELSAPACLGWTTYTTVARTPANGMNGHAGGLMVDKWRESEDDDVEGTDHPGGYVASLSRLSKTIATLDITSVLPRLSALPIHALRFASNEQKFTTQAGVDTLFDPTRVASDDMTTFTTSSASGHTNFYLGDSVSLGHFPISSQNAFSMLTSHPLCDSQLILSSSGEAQPFHLDFIDLPLQRLGGSLLHVITTQTTRIQDLVGYITQTLRCMQSDLTSNLQLPNRIIANITEELSSQGDSDLVHELYHLAMTGTFSAAILEWLTESIRENTHKRWDKAVNDMYNHIQNHIFVNLIPALDRLAIATDAIRGHARAHDGTDAFVPPNLFTKLMDDIDSLRLAAQKLQLLVMTEHRQFRAFSKWLRAMVEVGSAGPGSKAAIETEERELPNVDYSLVLIYIKDTLTKSNVTSYLDQRSDMKGIATQSDFWNHPQITASSHEAVTAALRTPESNDHSNYENNHPALLNLPTLAVRLRGQARLAIASITQWQSEMLSPPQTLSISSDILTPQSRILDMKVYPTSAKDGDGDSTTHVLSTTEDDIPSAHISLLRITRNSARQAQMNTEIFPLPAGEVLHAKLLRRDYCIALLKLADAPVTLLLSCDLKAYMEQGDPWIQRLHSFPEDGGFEPANLVIGGRPGKMVCVVCASGGQAWRVFDLDRVGKVKLSEIKDDNEVDEEMGQ